MRASILVPVSPNDPDPADCLRALGGQTYDPESTEILVVGYGGCRAGVLAGSGSRARVRHLEVDAQSPYVARNYGARHARGDVLLFTETACVPEPGWVEGHLATLGATRASVSVGQVAPFGTTRDLDLICAYEKIRDEFVFSGGSWRHLFGRPKNMAITRRRFESHGPFVEVMRGSDSELVQKVAREVSCDEVALAPAAVVRQPAVTDVLTSWRDRYVHNHSMHVFGSAHAAPVSATDRVAVFERTRREHRLGPLDAARLLVLLSFGILAFRGGGWSARLLAAGREGP